MSAGGEGRLDFEGYDPEGFEQFCYELLRELGFVNVDWRKETVLPSSPADRGRGLQAQLRRVDIDGSEHYEWWFIDCKHYKTGVPPESLQGLLTWAWAGRPAVALVIASGFLSNPAKDYLDQYEKNNRPPFRIKVWERSMLEQLTREKRDSLERVLRRDDLVRRADQEIPTLSSIRPGVCKGSTDRGVIPSGLTDLDRLTQGFRPGELIVVGGRPSIGKSALMLQFALTAAIEHRRGVAIFSLEMAKEHLVERMLCHQARIDSQRLSRGLLSDPEYERMASALGPLGDAPIVIDDSLRLDPDTLGRGVLEAKRQAEASLIIVDYVQLMQDYSPGFLKALARELQVSVIAVSQLSANPDNRVDKRPLLTDLPESEELEHEADLVLLLYRDDYYRGSESEIPGIAEIIVAKNRHGPTATVQCAFHPELYRFEDLQRKTPA